jgi:carboxypeptidase Q
VKPVSALCLLGLFAPSLCRAASVDDIFRKALGANPLTLVRSLSGGIGARLAGSPEANRAVDWAERAMRAVGLNNVHREPVRLVRWVRGAEAAELVAPRSHPLQVLGLGGTVATPPSGVTAEVVEVDSIEALHRLGSGARGKMVLFNREMAPTVDGSGYEHVVLLRRAGAIEAARVGAVAALIRSTGTGDPKLPHTGATQYDDGVDRIPFAALSAEDALLLHRMIKDGRAPRVRLRLGGHMEEEVESANVVGEIPGSDRASEIVLIGAHLDSWDVGRGALDDAAGCALVLEVARLLGAASPRRTVRVVLFMNEERGLSGARAYADLHASEVSRHVVALEADAGAGRPLGFYASTVALVKKLSAPLESVHAADVVESEEAGADLRFLIEKGVPVVSLRQDMTHYFDWHHTMGDTIDKIEPTAFKQALAALTVMTYGLSNSDETLPRGLHRSP